MASLITNNFNSAIAEQFVSSISDNTNSYYMFVGKPTTWAVENTPPAPQDSIKNKTEYLYDVLALKKITANEVKQCVLRHDWSAGTVYTQYDDASTTLSTASFYVLIIPENHVYKCISNNSGAASTTRPTGTSVNIIETADGYKWKYMYSLSDADLLKFYTENYMAVNTNEDVAVTAVSGSIDTLKIITGGTGYSSLNTTVTVKGNGSGFLCTPNIVNEIITGIIVTDPGSGYTFANVIVSGIGSNANIRAIIGPYEGHGTNSAEELGARYAMINTRLDYAEGAGDFPVVNDYRQVGIIKNPKNYSTNTVATARTLSASYKITANIISGTFSNDEIITSNILIANAIVVSANVLAGNVIINYITPYTLLSGNINFAVGEQIRGNTSTAVARILSIDLPEYKKNTGKILYVENRVKITRASDQAENIHIVVEF